MKDLLAQLLDGEPLHADQAMAAFSAIMSGEADPAQTGALLALIQQRGPTLNEIVGAARVMRAKATPVTVPDGLTAVDTCGTGGDHAGTFNISTAAALVAAGAGRPVGLCVAKHGNRAVTSKSGSSQVLETLGVTLLVEPEALPKCLDKAGLCFCFAPAHHPAMKHAAPIRAALGFRTIFNIVGPLTNPAGAARQVVGVFDAGLVGTIAEALLALGAEAAMVACGSIPDADGRHTDAIDELSSCGPTQLVELRDGRLHRRTLEPAEVGLPFGHPSALRVEGPEASAALIRKVLGGEHGPARDIVMLNAAAALHVGGVCDGLEAGLQLAGEALDSGAARGALETLCRVTAEHAAPPPEPAQ
ncbi:MAG: anthranilate phosphoribosyltransferase [Planctomycetota bacterium]